MLSKKEQQNLSEEQMAAYCVSISKYSKLGYKTIVSKDTDRTNPLSTEDGGAVVFTVDHSQKLEVAYPNIKRVRPYALRIHENRNKQKGYIKQLDEIYSANHRDNEAVLIFKDNKLY